MAKFRDNFDFIPDELKIIEVYNSLQGEGIDIGKEVIFVRTSGCSLSCVWCDTKHSWTGKVGYSLKPIEVMAEVAEETKGSKNVIITGGEPLIQPAEALIEFTSLLKEHNYHVAWETNGFHLPEIELVDNTDLFTVSPKLSSSKQPMYPVTLIDSWAELCKDKIQLKFVISDKDDMEEAVYLITSSDVVFQNKTQIIFQPEESKDFDIYKSLPTMAGEVFEEKGYNVLDYNIRYIPQIHKHYTIR